VPARIILIATAIFFALTCWFFVKWNFANTIASRLDTSRPETKIVADWLTQVAPADPQTHYGAAIVFEKTMDAEDLNRSLNEYEQATALSPDNFLMWLALGKSRNLNGDADGALAAFRRASELAPNYSQVQWILGNTLVRRGQLDEGFAFISKAAASNTDYAGPAASIAFQMFDGDIARVREKLGDNNVTNAALASILAEQQRYDDAVAVWDVVADKRSSQRKLGESLAAKLAAAGRFRLAAHVLSDLAESDAEKPVVGEVVNGGFEDGVKQKNAGLFEWQIADGGQPQIGLAEGQAHGGKYNLWFMFNSFEAAAFRSASKTVPIEPGAEYEFEMFYRSDLKTSATLKWEIADAGSTFAIASTSAMVPAAEWTPLRVRFRAKPDTDGITIRLARDGCAGPSCPINGKLSVDDFSLRRL
jgi:tetratricopeptide (TPR) repeat protein